MSDEPLVPCCDYADTAPDRAQPPEPEVEEVEESEEEPTAANAEEEEEIEEVVLEEAPSEQVWLRPEPVEDDMPTSKIEEIVEEEEEASPKHSVV